MKKISKFLGILLIMALVMSISVSAFAATIVVESGTTAADNTESQDVLNGETYNAYKILNYTSADTNDDGTPDAYSYYLTAEQYDEVATTADDGTVTYSAKENGLGDLLKSVGFEFTRSADGTQYFVSNGEDLDETLATALYAIKDKIAAKAIAKATATATADKQAVFSNLDTGYWFVTSSLGALCSLQSYDDQAMIVEKNTMITDTKVADETNVQVGDTVTYTITLTDGKGTNLPAKIIDTMSKGLSYNDDAVATANGTALTKGTDFTVTTKTLAAADVAEGADYEGKQIGSTVVIYTFTADVMTALEENQTIVVTYTAEVTEDASLDGTEQNTEFTEYSEQETEPTTVIVELEDLTINKTDGTNALKGAQFKLYRTDAALGLDHVDVKLTQLTDAEIAEALATTSTNPETGAVTTTPGTAAANTVYYKVDPNGTNLIDMAQKEGDDYLYSSAVVFGLDKDSTYYLEETKAPEGYNLLSEEKEVSLNTSNSIDVVNNKGTVLPSTGGIGTTIFYVVGSILVVAAGVLLITKKRMSREG